jgi:hypothetical protein
MTIYETVHTGPGAIRVRLQARKTDADHRETWAAKPKTLAMDYSLNAMENHQHAVAAVAGVAVDRVTLGGENVKGYLWVVA